MCSQCGHQASVTAGTIFHRSHLPLRTWFRAMWWLTNQKHGVSALGLQRLLGLGSYRTAWACLQKIRRAMVRTGRDSLAGQVEVDETYVGGVEAGRGRRRVGNKALVVIAAQVDGGGDRAHPPSPDSGRFRPKPHGLREERGRAGIHRDHGWMGRIRGTQGARIHAQAPGDQREREDCVGTPAPGASGGGPVEALVVGHPSGGGIARATRFLPRRVHIPLQPANIPAPGEALLQARGTSRIPPADSLLEACHSFGPQRVVGAGLKCIALKL